MDNQKEAEGSVQKVQQQHQQQLTANNVPPPKPPRLHQQQREKVDPSLTTMLTSPKKQRSKKVLHFQSPLQTRIQTKIKQTGTHATYSSSLPSMQAAGIVNKTTKRSQGKTLDKPKDISLYLPTPKVTTTTTLTATKTKQRLAQGCSSLMYACQQGDIVTVLEQLRTKPERIRQRDSRNKSALHYCAELQQRNLVAAASIAIAAPELLESADEDGFTPLHLAVIQGNLAMVNLLLANKADVNAVDNEGHSVVHWATVCGEVEALRSVLAAGANVTTPDINGGSPLHYAAQMCGANYEGKLGQASSSKLSLEILGILLAHPQSSVDLQDKDGRQPLLWAASAGSAKAVIALVKAGARVESADKDGLTALHCAASRGHTECIDTLISLCGAPTDLIDSNGCTALHYAVTLGHADATSRLLDLEADPNRQDRKGRTPAHCGCSKGQFETVKLLKERGANLWLRNAKGDLPVHEAASSGRRELVEWLLEQRPKQVNTTSNDGRSLLHIAAANDYTDMCKMLLDYGADINAIYRNSKGVVITPLDCALQKAHRSTAKFIQSNGGSPASKLRLSARRSNPFQDTNAEAVRPLKYAEKEEIHDLSNSKKYVVYLKRSDSDNGGEGSCSCTEQTYKKEQKYSHICRRHQRSKRHSRRRTSSCGEAKATEHCRGQQPCSDICRSKSNIEIRRKSKSRERYASSSEEDGEEDEDSCENCCYHKKSKQRVVKRRSISTRRSRELRDSDDDDDEHDVGDVKKNGIDAAMEAESKQRDKREVAITKSNENVAMEKQKSTSRPPSKTLGRTSRPQSATATKRRTPTPTHASTVQQAGATKDGTFIKTPPEPTADEMKSMENKKPTALDLTDDEEDLNAKIASELVTTLVDVHRSADDAQSNASLKLHDEETEKQQTEVNAKITDEAEATLEARVAEQISKEVDQLLVIAATAVTNEDAVIVKETQQTKPEDGKTAEMNGKAGTEGETKKTTEKVDKESIAPPQLIQTPATPAPTPVPTPTPTPLPTPVATPQTAKTSTANEENANVSVPTTAIAPIPAPPTASPTTAASASPTALASKTANEADVSSSDQQQQQQQREQESRRSFTLLPSDSGDEEQPIRKSSFQVLKSDESVDLEGEAPDVAQNDDEHYDEEFSDTQVFKIMPDTHAEVTLSSQDEAEEDEANARIEDDEDDDDEEASVDDDEDIPVGASGSPMRRFTSSGNRHGVGVISKTPPPPTQAHDYDYSNGRKRRLKKRIRSGAKTRSNWKASSGPPGTADNSGGVGQQQQQQSAKDQDSGFEPSPRATKSKIPTPRNIYTAHIPGRRPIYATLDGRSCSSRIENRKPGDKGACDMAAVTRSIQRNIRRYYMERKIFQHLLELKSLQIRSNKLNEAVLVKRAIDEYHKSCAALNGETGSRLRRYPYTEYTFKNFELFLYETLKALQKPGTFNFQNIHEVYEEAERRLSPDYNMYAKALQCTTKTHRCLHAAHAYTGIPCAAYIPMMNHHTMPKFGFGPYKKTGVGSFYLPKILSSNSSCGGKVSLELSHGKNKQLISLPSEKLDSNKRYYVTFTVKESQSALETKQQQQTQPQQQSGGGVSSCTINGATKCTTSGQVNNERN